MCHSCQYYSSSTQQILLIIAVFSRSVCVFTCLFTYIVIFRALLNIAPQMVTSNYPEIYMT